MRLSKRVWLLAWVIAACADERSVGSDPCRGDEIDCVIPEAKTLQSEIVAEVSTSDSTPLDPTWIRDVRVADSDGCALLSRPDASLWLFSTTDSGLMVTGLDADGNETGSSSIAAPSDLEAPKLEAGSLDPALISDSPRGPVMPLTWEHNYVRSKSENWGQSYSTTTELLVFGNSLDEAPKRPRVSIAPLGFHTFVQAFRDAEGDVLTVSVPGGVTKIDPEGEATWMQPALARVYYAGLSMGAVLPSGELALAVHTWPLDDPDGTYPELFRIDRTGTVRYHAKLQRYVVDPDLPTIDGMKPLSLVNPFNSNAVSSVIDSRGRWTIASSLSNGDLDVVRVEAERNQLSGYRFTRDEYQELRPSGLAVDAAGTVYVSPSTGPRDVTKARQLICRVPDEGEPRCFVVPVAVKQLRATTANVVYALRTSDAAVVRFDFPD